MTTEDDFQAALDANPSDWQTRLVFADWLQDRGDPRAEGYRALGLGRLMPARVPYDGSHRAITRRKGPARKVVYLWYRCQRGAIMGVCLNDDWMSATAVIWRGRSLLSGEWAAPIPRDRLPRTRREAEDAAALAFAKLPPERRAELLAVPVGAP